MRLSGQTPSPDGIAPFADAILVGMADGVLVVERNGVISQFNPAAEQITGRSAGDVIGSLFAEQFLEEQANLEFADLVLGAVTDPRDGFERVDVEFVRPDGNWVVLSVAMSLLQDADDPDRRAIICVFGDVTERVEAARRQKALADELSQSNTDLTRTLRDLEEARREAERLEALRRKLVYRGGAGIIVALFIVGATDWARLPETVVGLQEWLAPGPAVTEAAAERPAFVATATPVRQTVNLSGRIEPGTLVDVPARVSGTVVEKLFEFGTRVDEGVVLAALENRELETGARDAEAEVIRVNLELEALRNWDSGQELARARRSLAQASDAVNRAMSTFTESEKLFQAGVIAEQELRSQEQQVTDRRFALEAAEEEVRSVEAKAAPEQVRIVEFKLANAEDKLNDLTTQLNELIVVSPTGGILIEPANGSGEGGAEGNRGSADIKVGSKVNAGDLIATIGLLDRLRVKTELNELDISRIRVGQRATVSGAAFAPIEMPAVVHSVSDQAAAGNNRVVVFEVTIETDRIEPEWLDAVRMGMSAEVEVTTYQNPDAIIVPPSYLRGSPSEPAVTVLKDDGTVEERSVQLGIRLPRGIEIIAGLQDGERIVE